MKTFSIKYVFVAFAIAITSAVIYHLCFKVSETSSLKPLEPVLFSAVAAVVIFSIIEAIRYWNEKIIEDAEHLRSIKDRNQMLEDSLLDIVKNFGDDGIGMNRNTFEKIKSLSRAKAVLGIINTQDIENRRDLE